MKADKIFLGIISAICFILELIINIVLIPVSLVYDCFTAMNNRMGDLKYQIRHKSK